MRQKLSYQLLGLNEFSLMFWGLVIFFMGSLLSPAAGPMFWIISRLVSGVFLFGAFVLFLRSGRKPPGSVFYINAFIILVIYVGIISLPNVVQFLPLGGARSALAGDLVAFSLLSVGLTYWGLNLEQKLFIFKAVLVMSAFSYLVTLPFTDTSFVGQAATRQVALMELQEDRTVYWIQMSISSLFPALFLASWGLPLRRFWQLLATLCLGFTAFTALYYSKRSVTLDFIISAALFVGAMTLAGRIPVTKRILRLAGFTVVGAAGLYLAFNVFGENFMVVYERLTGRFDVLLLEVSQIDRVIELRAYWAYLPGIRRLIGSGCLFFTMSAATGEYTNSLHIGWGTLFYKGGWVFVAFALVLFLRNIFKSLKYIKTKSAIIGLTLPIYYGMTLGHSTIFGAFHSTVGLSFALFLFPAMLGHELAQHRQMSRPPGPPPPNQRPGPPRPQK